jgi:hypothetical protein
MSALTHRYTHREIALVWRFGGWLGGFVVEDSGIGLVEGWRSGFGVGDGFGGWGDGVGLGGWWWGVGFGGEPDAVGGMQGIGGIDGVRDRSKAWQGRGHDGVLEGEGGFGSALPETGEEHEEEAKLCEEKRRPDARLREHVH